MGLIAKNTETDDLQYMKKKQANDEKKVIDNREAIGCKSLHASPIRAISSGRYTLL